MPNFMYTLILFVFGCICIELFYWIKNRTKVSYKKEAIEGERFSIVRDNTANIEVNQYVYDGDDNQGLIIVCHGGSLLNGDADMCDTFCKELRDASKCVVASIHYAKLNECKPPFQQQQIMDTVLYYMSHKNEYHITKNNVVMVGFSGGAYLEIGAACLLSQIHQINIRGMILYYPLLDDSIINLTKQNFLQFPISIVTCNNENENKMVATWCEHLKGENVDYTLKEYLDAMQGFIEYNYPEYLENPQFKRNLRYFDEDQKDIANANFMWLTNEISRYTQEEK